MHTTRPAAALPPDVAAHDDVTHGARLLVEGVRHNGGGHGELHRGGVDDADHVARSGGLKDAEERPVEAGPRNRWTAF